MLSHIDEYPIKLVQLTDLHLFEQPGAGVGWCDACRDLDTDETLQAVLSSIQAKPHVDAALVVTGDISQQATTATYRRFIQFFEPLCRPVFCLPGNHDDAQILKETVVASVASAFQVGGHVVVGRWLWVFLDSSQADEEPAGLIGKEELLRLTKVLSDHPRHHAMIFVHHHPVDIGSAWLDEIGIHNRAELFELVAEFNQLKAIVFGHVHQEFDAMHGGIRMLGTPSTCVQFKPKQTAFAYDDLPPAYRWLNFHEDGEFDTGVEYLDELPTKAASFPES